MATPRKTQILQLGAPEPEILSDMEQDEEMAIMAAQAELGNATDVTINVYKQQAGRGLAFVDSYAAGDFTVKAVQAEYGGGDYRVHFKRAGKLVANKALCIAIPKTPPGLPVPQGISAEAVARMIADSNAQLLAGFRALTPAAAPIKTTMEMLQEMQLMAQIMRPAGNQPDQLGQLRSMMEIVKELQPAAPDDGSGMGVLMKALELFGKPLAEAAASGMLIPQPVPQTLPRPVGAPVIGHVPPRVADMPPALSPQTQPSPQETAEMLSVQSKLNLLCIAASNNSDPLSYANLIVDMVPETQIKEFLAAPNWLESLAQFSPEVRRFPEWFAELKTAVEELLTVELEATTVIPAIPLNGDPVAVYMPDPGQTPSTSGGE